MPSSMNTKPDKAGKRRSVAFESVCPSRYQTRWLSVKHDTCIVHQDVCSVPNFFNRIDYYLMFSSGK